MGGVGPDAAYAADPARPRYRWQVQRIVALAAQHFAGIGQHLGGGDIDDDLAGPEHRIGHAFDGERRAKGLQDCCFHDLPLGWRPILATF